MAVSDSYRQYVIDQLSRVEPVTSKRMFGGVGIYCGELFFALIAEDQLYFKVDDSTRPAYEAQGMEPFRPFGEEHAMGYYEVPVAILENTEMLGDWMRAAMEVARNAKRKRPHKKPG